MPFLIFALLFLIPMAEIAVFVKVSAAIGFGTALLITLATAVIGTLLVRHQGLATWARAQSEMNAGRPPVAEMLTGVALLLAGLFLATPGFLTDTVGFLLLIPPVRRGLGRRLAQWLLRHGRLRTAHGETRRGAYTYIDADYEDITGGPAETPDDVDKRRLP